MQDLRVTLPFIEEESGMKQVFARERVISDGAVEKMIGDEIGETLGQPLDPHRLPRHRVCRGVYLF